MRFIKKLRPTKKLLLLTFVGVVIILSFFVYRKTYKHFPNRILVLVVENNNSIGPDFVENYENNRFWGDLVLSILFKVPRKDLEDKNLIQIVDQHGEDYLAGRFKKAAKGYEKVIVLSDEEASYQNFKNTLLNLSRTKDVVDVLLDLHGDGKRAYFYGGSVAKEEIVKDFENNQMNLGFVYQTLCVGKGTMDAWVKIGAEVSNGSRGTNHLVFLAPEKFIKSWVRGNTFKKAVEDGYNHELSIRKFLARFTSLLYPIEAEQRQESIMEYSGNPELKITD